VPDGDTKLKAVDFVRESATQLITLSSAILVFSGTFYKDIVSGAPAHRSSFVISWFLFLLSLVPGILVLGALSSDLKCNP
jgi:hypothetical protein